MKEDIFVVSGAMGKALATKAAGKKTVSQDSVILDLHGGVQDVASGKSNIFNDSKRKMRDGQGLFMFPETSGLSPEEKEEKEKKYQENLVKLMEAYQRYHDLIRDEEYAPRGSKMTCSYGTKTALLDTMEDHGVYKGPLPVMTCKDCRKWNLHDFGSCMSPESMYKGRVDMTVPVRNGHTAQKAPGNKYPHICVPLVDEKSGWHQTIGEVWIKNEEGEAERVLVRRAFLACRYGGLISIEEVADTKENEKKDQLITMEQMQAFQFKIAEAELDELNQLLEEYGITDRGSIALFMATCGHESAMGTILLEKGTDEYFAEQGYTRYTRGAGYIQITGNDHERFYKSIGIQTIPVDSAQDIADHYAWRSAVWEWAKDSKGDNVIMNEYVTQHGHGENIFLVTQYFINGYLSKDIYPNFNSDLSDIRKGKDYYCHLDGTWTDSKGKKHTGVLEVNGRSYRLPKNYADRLEKYKSAVKCFMEEKKK